MNEKRTILGLIGGLAVVYLLDAVVRAALDGFVGSDIIASGVVFQSLLLGYAVLAFNRLEMDILIDFPDRDALLDVVFVVFVSSVITFGAASIFYTPSISIRVLTPLTVVGLVSVHSLIVFAPLAEELFFRGMLYPLLKTQFSVGAAMGVVSVVFALSHLTGGLGLFLTLLSGLFYVWLYEKHGNLTVPILAHALENMIGVVW